MTLSRFDPSEILAAQDAAARFTLAGSDTGLLHDIGEVVDSVFNRSDAQMQASIRDAYDGFQHAHREMLETQIGEMRGLVSEDAMERARYKTMNAYEKLLALPPLAAVPALPDWNSMLQAQSQMLAAVEANVRHHEEATEHRVCRIAEGAQKTPTHSVHQIFSAYYKPRPSDGRSTDSDPDQPRDR